MGDVIAFAFGPIAIPGAGTFTLDYVHPATANPSKIGMISCQLSAGTQTGKVIMSYGSDPTNACGFYTDGFTANDNTVMVNPEILIQPGQTIRLAFTNVTAGDTLRVFIEGH